MRYRRLIGPLLGILLLAGASLLSACGQAGETAAPKRLPTDSLKLTPNANGADITFTTEEPGFCLVTVGTEPGKYTRAVPESMPDGPHREHVNVIRGLEPETTYYYQITFTNDRGELSRSEEQRFVTTARGEDAATGQPNPDRPAGLNVALKENGGRILDVSSNYGGAANDEMWGAEGAIDGSYTTAWSSDGDGDDAWIELGFDATYTVTAVGFQTRTMGSSAEIAEVLVRLPGGRELGRFSLEGADRITYYSLPTPVETDRLRFEAVETTGGNTGAVEIEVYALAPGES